MNIEHERPLEFADLVAWFAAGGKPPSAFRVGAEHEKLVFATSDLRPPSYDGPKGIRALLEGLRAFGWSGTYETDEDGEPVLIGLSRGAANISLEPGGQFELSGAPLADMHEICEETGRHLEESKAVAEPLGLAFAGLGFNPLWRRDDIPMMPKGRYRIMRALHAQGRFVGPRHDVPHLHGAGQPRLR